MPITSRSRLKIYNEVRKVALRVCAVGLLTYLRFELLKLTGRRIERRIMIYGRWPVWVRSATPDLRTAVVNLTEEFDCLSQLLPEGYSGLIVDGGGYIGTAALKFSEMYPNATIVTVEPSSVEHVTPGEEYCRKGQLRCDPGPNLRQSRTGPVKLFDPGRKEWGYTIVEEEVAGVSASVLESADTITLGGGICQVREQGRLAF